MESQVKDITDPDQVWDTFEKSMEKFNLYQDYCDLYIGDFRQGHNETITDLDLCIRHIVQGSKFKDTEEERHYKLHKYVQVLEEAELTQEVVLEKAKTHEKKLPGV